MARQFFKFKVTFVVGYYNEFTLVRRKFHFHLFLKTIESIIIFSRDQYIRDDHGMERPINFQVKY